MREPLDFPEDYAEACDAVHTSLLQQMQRCAAEERDAGHLMDEREMAEWVAHHHSQAIIVAFSLGAMWRDQWPNSDIRLGVQP
jgi:hypothetical protein